MTKLTQLRVITGLDRQDVAARIESGRGRSEGPARLVVWAPTRLELVLRARTAGNWLRRGGPAPEGVVFRDEPVDGEIAFVFPSGSMAYPGMGHELVGSFPAQADVVQDRFGRALRTLMPVDSYPTNVMHQVWATLIHSAVHAEILAGVLGLRPDAAIGYSTGEIAAAASLGLWSDVRQVLDEVDQSEFVDNGIVGELRLVRRAWQRLGLDGTSWRNIMLSGPPHDVVEALRDEPAVHLTGICAPGLCAVGGEEHAVARVIDVLSRTHIAIPVPYDIAVHTPMLQDAAPQLRELYMRPVNSTTVRIYSSTSGTSYRPTPDALAHMLAEHLIKPVDFVRVVEQAYTDGVRVFVELGPQGMCTTWIRRILGNRPHLAVALDSRTDPGHQLGLAIAELVAADVAAHPGTHHMSG